MSDPRFPITSALFRVSILGLCGVAAYAAPPAQAPSTHAAPCAPGTTEVCQSCAPLKAGVAVAESVMKSTPAMSEAQFQKLVEKDRSAGQKIPSVMVTPSRSSCYSVTYQFPEKNLDPGEAIYLAIPPSLQDRPVHVATLSHRQDPNLPSNKNFKLGEYTTPPGRTSFQVLVEDAKTGQGRWRYYVNPNGGVKGSKFAEPSGSAEIETLYDWGKIGHADHETEEVSHDPIRPLALRMLSVGKNPVLVSEVMLKVLPPPPTEFKSAVFSKGTDLGDLEKGEAPVFGGGQKFGGKFPGAIPLGGYGSSAGSSPKLPAGWKVNGSTLTIPMDPGKKLTYVEVAAGDSHPDGVTNEDGGVGSKGWSKMSIDLVKADGTRQSLASRENVPPQGVIMGTPVECGYSTQSGDSIEIRADSDTSYVMAVRVGLR